MPSAKSHGCASTPKGVLSRGRRTAYRRRWHRFCLVYDLTKVKERPRGREARTPDPRTACQRRDSSVHRKAGLLGMPPHFCCGASTPAVAPASGKKQTTKSCGRRQLLLTLLDRPDPLPAWQCLNLDRRIPSCPCACLQDIELPLQYTTGRYHDARSLSRLTRLEKQKSPSSSIGGLDSVSAKQTQYGIVKRRPAGSRH